MFKRHTFAAEEAMKGRKDHWQGTQRVSFGTKKPNVWHDTHCSPALSSSSPHRGRPLLILLVRMQDR
jgi:hypothetical protein